MTKEKKPKPQVLLTESGVLLVGDGEETPVCARILNIAIGTRVPAGTKFAQVAFDDLDGNPLIESCDLADFEPPNRRRVIDRLSNLGYRWPPDRDIVDAIISRLGEDLPERRFNLVGAPGWYGDIYVTRRREYRKGHRRSAPRLFEIDQSADAHLANHLLGTGSLKRWKLDIGMLAIKSSCLRLSIAAALAAPMLRPLGVDSFGLNFFSESSTGKTTGVLVGAGGVGIIVAINALPGWADSEAGVRQLLTGNRDGVVPLDDVNSGDDGNLPKKLRALSYAIARGTPRKVDRRYEKAGSQPARDTRNIVLSSSEDSLTNMVGEAGRQRWTGEEVRLIDVPAAFKDSAGIFDKPLNCPDGLSSKAYYSKLVDKLKYDALLHQGFVFDAFMNSFVNDDEAITDLQGYMDNFLSAAKELIGSTTDQRIAAKFAVIYATASLAIDYDILPWGKKSTLKAFKKCLAGALGARLARSKGTTGSGNVVTAVQRLSDYLNTIDLVEVRKRIKVSSAEADRRRTAAGLETDGLIYVRREAWPITDPKETKLLVQAKVLVTESRSDVATMAKKVGGIHGKSRYYVVDKMRLATITGA